MHVDGNDVLRCPRRRGRGGRRGPALASGASFILADTYRWREHCGPNYDNELGYRTDRGIRRLAERDPIVEAARRVLAKQASQTMRPSKRWQGTIAEEVGEAFAAPKRRRSPTRKPAGQSAFMREGRVISCRQSDPRGAGDIVAAAPRYLSDR